MRESRRDTTGDVIRDTAGQSEALGAVAEKMVKKELARLSIICMRCLPESGSRLRDDMAKVGREMLGTIERVPASVVIGLGILA